MSVPKIPARMRGCWPTSTFSSAVMFANRRMFWKVRPIPRAVTWCGFRPLICKPSNSSVPLVGGYRPVIILKNVVLPAPFGPIRPLIEPRSITKSTLLTATKPPKRLVIPVASRTGAMFSLRQLNILLNVESADIFALGGLFVGMQLGPTADAWHQTLGTHQHHDHQHHTEQHQPIIGGPKIGQRRAVRVRSDLLEQVGEPVQEEDIRRYDQQAADDHARDIAQAAQDHHTQDQHQLIELEAGWRDRAEVRAIERAAEAREGRAKR